jgi:hypothetical protein
MQQSSMRAMRFGSGTVVARGMMGKRRSSVPAGSRKAETNKPYRVFVSHATADKWIAERICEQIATTGADYFRDDRDINGGDDITDKLRDGIQESQELVVLLTPESHDRP